MEIVRINDKKLKVTLSDTDMKKLGFPEDTLTLENTAFREALFRLLREAKTSAALDGGTRTLVEAFPGRNGGCEIFVVFLEGKKGKEKKKEYALFYFSSMERLRAAAKVFCAVFDEEESVLFRMPAGGYMLRFPSACEEGHHALSPYSFLSEYGEEKRGALVDAYIKEYGEILYTKDAFHILSTEENRKENA